MTFTNFLIIGLVVLIILIFLIDRREISKLKEENQSLTNQINQLTGEFANKLEDKKNELEQKFYLEHYNDDSPFKNKTYNIYTSNKFER